MLPRARAFWNGSKKKMLAPRLGQIEHDLRKLIDSIVARKAVAPTSRDLAKKSLGAQNGSPFTQTIANFPPPKKFSMPKFNIYNG